MSKVMEGAIDKFLGRVISRKLLVFGIGTGFFVAGLGLSADDWMSLALAYVGTQGFIDIVLAYKNGKVS